MCITLNNLFSMKKILLSILSCLLVFLGCATVLSCTEEEVTVKTKTETSTSTTVTTMNVSLNSYFSGVLYSTTRQAYLIANGETFYVDSLILDKEKSSEGLSIKNVKYYFDDKEISTVSAAPYRFSYPFKDETVGDHKLKYEVTTVLDGKESVTTCENSILVLSEPFTVDDALYLGDFEERVDNKTDLVFSKNETLTGHTELLGSSVNAKVVKVEYYWDSNLIAASSIAPYNFSYDLANETEGTHVLMRTTTVDCDYGTFEISTLVDITIE